MYIYIYVLLYVLQIHTYNTGERESGRETLPTIIPFKTVLIAMRGFQSCNQQLSVLNQVLCVFSRPLLARVLPPPLPPSPPT